MVAIPFLGEAMDFLAGNIGPILGAVGSALFASVSWLGTKYLAPFLKISKRKQYAQWIAVIADEITDELVHRHPNKKWILRLDEAVDRLADICEVSKEVSDRAVRAAVGRKKL